MKNESKRKVMVYIVFIIIAANSIGFLFLLLSCNPPSDIAETNQEQPDIFPDYKEVTIPTNIAPLNFRINEKHKSFEVILADNKGKKYTYTGKNSVQIKCKEWKKLLKDNTGNSITVTVKTFSTDRGWIKWEPFQIHISDYAIDSHLVYRLIEPGYEKWHIVGIYQRDLETFNEKPIIKNNMTGYNCINCHSFCGGDPQQMMFHMRAANGATYIVKDKQIQKLNTKTNKTISNLTYPYWHPSGRYITTSVNDIKQFFHAVKEKKMEVFDLESDVVVYDIENKRILSEASIISKEAYETFPSFSPDGKWLYYCSAPALPMPQQYDSIRYAIYRVPFDAAQGRIKSQVDTMVHSNLYSASFPRISPDGRFLMYTETAYGQFPIWHKDAEIRMIDLIDRKQIDMSVLNSEDTESYHSWSRNSRWVVVSSRRENGLYTLPYLAYIDESGNPSKPFLLPQKNPDVYDFLLYSYNLPELINGEVEISPYEIQHTALKTQAEQIVFN